MILRAKARKVNGTYGSGYWYVCSKYTLPNGTPSFTMSLDINKAVSVTREQADNFNNLFMKLGVIDKPFEIVN